ncbi:hypothetical protein ACEPAF_2484 [Sanghuangporus sanghuang]
MVRILRSIARFQWRVKPTLTLLSHDYEHYFLVPTFDALSTGYASLSIQRRPQQCPSRPQDQQLLRFAYLHELYSVIFGRAIKTEYLSLGTILTTAAIAYAATGSSKKQHVPSGGSSEEALKKVKDTVPINASSSEEEQLLDSIKNFIAEEEKKASHH